MLIKEVEAYYPKSKQQWRSWLTKNHLRKTVVWVILYKQKSNLPTITWSEAVEEALCFGWIDSIKKTLDDERSIQFFSKRKPNSTWSKINKDKVKNLIEAGKMTTAGLQCVEIAKQNGTWNILDTVEALIIPTDLEKEFKTKKGTKNFFLTLSKTNRKAILQWLVLAKRPETRLKRITEIVQLASQMQKPKHLQ